MVKASTALLSGAGLLAASLPSVQASWEFLAINVTHPTHETTRRLEQSCVLELSTDFVANDIGNVPGATPGDCCAKCAANTGCGAFSWTNYNGGTCYLKSGKGATKTAAGVTSAVVISVPSGSCSVENGVDYVGNDIANSPGQASDCCAKCSVQNGCGAFTWSNHNGGTCWLKSGKGNTAVASGVVSGVRAPATCSQEPNVDYSGNDLSNARGDAGSCCGKCATISGCKAYTWSDYQGGTCWLKTGKGATKSAAGVVSGEVGVVTPPPTTPAPTTPTPTTPTPTSPTPTTPAPTTPAPTTPTPTTSVPVNPQCQIQKDVDFVGNDVGSVPGADSSACCNKCLEAPGCNAFSWTSFNGGTCYLKSGQGATKAAAGVDSAVVARPPPQNSCTINANTDYVGLDIANVQRSKPEDCCGACASYSGCGAFTWTDFNGGTCWLKSAAGQSSYKAGSHSAVVTVVNPPKNHIQYQMRSGAVPLKSVNLGGWLVGEYWMSYTSPHWKNAWNYANQGEYAVMRGLGHGADGQFEEHRRTWITEDDIRQIADAGLNAVRVPVGYWIVADDPTTWKNDAMRVFAPGSLKYLDKLINEWAVKYNLAVMLSLHAHLGSQNGFDHSAPFALNQISWGYGESVENSLQLATFLAARYKLSPAFLGMNLMNEPAFGVNVDTLKYYYMEAYRRIRATGNDCILVTSPLLQQQGPGEMRDLMRWPQYNNVWHEFHIYYKWGDNAGRNEWQIIGDAGTYRRTHLDPWPGNYLYMGEWSLASPDSAKFYDLNVLREFARVQMEQFKGAHSGWAFWSWKHGDEAKIESRGWSLREMLRLGVISLK